VLAVPYLGDRLARSRAARDESSMYAISFVICDSATWFDWYSPQAIGDCRTGDKMCRRSRSMRGPADKCQL